MKQILLLLLALPLFIACSDDDDEKQDYTSFQIMQNQIESQPNTIIGYKVDGKYKRLAELGDLKMGEWSKEIKIEDDSINELYVFTDYNSVIRLDVVLTLKKKTSNRFELPANTKGIGISDKSDPTQYPQ